MPKDSKIKEILLVPHTHHDIGYTHIPETCLRMHERFIEEAMSLCERYADSDPAAFRWTVEISKPLLRFLYRAPESQVEQLRDLIRRGRMSVTAGYLHMTQLIGHEEYVRFFAPVRELRDRYGLPVSVVQHGDINGLSWGSVPLMRDAGLDTLVMALNPDHGRAPFEQPTPFVWEGQDGSRVMVLLNLFYSLANNPWELTAGRIDSAREPVAALIRRLEERDDYPFDFVIIHSAEDNMLPNDKLSRAVALWNEAGLEPFMRITTLDEVVSRARPYMASLPVQRGEWADWWANGHGSSAYEVGLSRLARAEIRTADVGRSLLSIAGAASAPPTIPGELPIVNWYRVGSVSLSELPWRTRVDAVYDNLLLFEEHTWGTFESIRLPFSTFTQTHWNAKAAFAFEATNEAHNLSREALSQLAAALPSSDQPAVIVINPLSTVRDDLVTVRTPGVNHALYVPDIPPLGVKVVPWNPAECDAVTPIENSSAGSVYDKGYYRIEIDPKTASIRSLIDKRTGREWVDSSALAGIGAVVYEEPDPLDEHPAKITDQRNKFHPDYPGPRFVYFVGNGTGEPRAVQTHYGTVITLTATAPFMPRIETVITLYDTQPWIDITVTVLKQENYDIEGAYILFPFALENPEFLLETANAVYCAESEQLPDTCKDWYSIQHGIGVTNGESGVLWATREAPLVMLGDFQAGKWARTLDAPRGHIYSWTMNNLYFTNFKAAQGGQMQFSYRFTTYQDVTPESVRAWGESFALTPLARVAPVQAGEYRWLEVAPENVQVQVLKPADDDQDALTLRIKECAGRDTDAVIRWLAERGAEMIKTDMLERGQGDPLSQDDNTGGNTFTVSLRGHELATIRITLR